ncbi:serine/threonine-protein kinase [Nocardiopsis sp. Huas11]|uniref:serine/threonine-protein kinase n=1 Tax=Nocardiopsis sp. Huas11 TaxID=2183912 RepID=UPI0011C359AA|nr:serine/threonine-protein kinase [Nocardiopsis sp. Huas11]
MNAPQGTVARLPPLSPLTGDDPEALGGHVLLGRIGSGGMGVVFLARPAEGALLAVKVANTSYAQDPEFRARFAREVALAQRVRAACTPAIRAVGLNDERPWMAMEYVPGPTLSAHVRASGTLEGARLLSFALGTAEALVAIHRAGVVHRDLKPGNVVLGPRGPSVLDFGIARALDVASRTRAVHGTPGYVAPERMRGQEGPWVDVFSWGAVTAFAATGRPPFGTGEPVVRVQRAARGEADLDGLAPPLLPLVRASLSPDFGSRPTSEELFEALMGVLDEDSATVGRDERERTDRVLTRTWRSVDAPRSTASSRTRSERSADRPRKRAGPSRRPRRTAREGGGVTFAGRVFTDPAHLVHALSANHRSAGTWLRAGGAQTLRRWPPLRENARVRAVLHGVSRRSADPQWALTALSVCLCPNEAPLYRGVAIDADGLAALARAGERGADRSVLTEAFDRGVVGLAASAGDARTRRLADRVPGLVEEALGLVRSVCERVDRDRELRVWELAVLVVLGEDPPPEDGPRLRWRPGALRLWRRAATDSAARIVLAVCAPGSRPPLAGRGERAGRTGSDQPEPQSGLGSPRAPSRLRPAVRAWRQTLLASAMMPSLPLLALSMGMVMRPFAVPYRPAEATETGMRLGAEAAGRAGDLCLPVLALAVVVSLIRPEHVRAWITGASLLAAVAALPALPLPGLWAPAALRDALTAIGQSWGGWVQWGGLLMGGACTALVAVFVLAGPPASFPLLSRKLPPLQGRGSATTEGEEHEV